MLKEKPKKLVGIELNLAPEHFLMIDEIMKRNGFLSRSVAIRAAIANEYNKVPQVSKNLAKK